jgi:hypothetical protein
VMVKVVCICVVLFKCMNVNANEGLLYEAKEETKNITIARSNHRQRLKKKIKTWKKLLKNKTQSSNI